MNAPSSPTNVAQLSLAAAPPPNLKKRKIEEITDLYTYSKDLLSKAKRLCKEAGQISHASIVSQIQPLEQMIDILGIYNAQHEKDLLALQQESEEFPALLFQLETLEASNDWNGCIQLLKQSPLTYEMPILMLKLQNHQMRLKDFASAIGSNDQLISLYPENPAIQCSRAYLLEGLNRYTELLEFTKAAYEKNPGAPHAETLIFGWAKAAYKLKQLSEAQEICDIGCVTFPDSQNLKLLKRKITEQQAKSAFRASVREAPWTPFST